MKHVRLHTIVIANITSFLKSVKMDPPDISELKDTKIHTWLFTITLS